MRKVHETLAPYYEAEPEKVADACHVLARLVDGGALDEREYWSAGKRETQQWQWAPARPMTIQTGQTVRVAKDAYPETDSRRVHNGRVGVVVALRRDVVVNYTDGMDHGLSVGQHHDWHKLEQQVRI